jgi:hypothetical protein
VLKKKEKNHPAMGVIMVLIVIKETKTTTYESKDENDYPIPHGFTPRLPFFHA